MGERTGAAVAVAHDLGPEPMSNPVPFDTLLAASASLDTAAWVYLPSSESWTLKSPAMVLRSVEVAPEEEDDPMAGIPPEAKANGLMQALPITVLQDIVSNATTQKPNATIDDLFRAFLHYYDHDSFIEIP